MTALDAEGNTAWKPSPSTLISAPWKRSTAVRVMRQVVLDEIGARGIARRSMNDV